jgi:hypothetical protein
MTFLPVLACDIPLEMARHRVRRLLEAAAGCRRENSTGLDYQQGFK